MQKTISLPLKMAILAASLLRAAGVEPPQLQNAPSLSPPAASEASQADREIASLLLAERRGWLEIAALAARRSENAGLRQFANDMERRQFESNAILAQWAAHRPHHRDPSPDLDWVALHNELEKKAAQSAQNELTQSQGGEFDRAFLKLQIVLHRHALDELAVLKTQSSPAFRNELEKEQEMETHFLDRAQRLLAGQGAASGLQASKNE